MSEIIYKGIFHSFGAACVLLLTAHLSSASEPLTTNPRPIKLLLENGFVEVNSGQALKSTKSRSFLKATDLAQSNAEIPKSPSFLTMNVYIEGDGAAWKARQIPPSDPTPENPMGAKLASIDRSALVGYIGRPCMYLPPFELQSCPQTLWTSGRFGEQALNISSQALDNLIQLTRARLALHPNSSIEVNLIGYSGGGVLATLLAAQRSDIACLVTIASPLDIEVWTRYQNIAPLIDSFNPAYPDIHLKTIPQTHFYGAKDKIVPAESLGRYENWSENRNESSTIQILLDFNHHEFCVEKWALLQSKSCLNNKN